jgi:hypothetical protein
MADQKTFTLSIRLYADGQQFSLTEQEREDGSTFEEILGDSMDGMPYREFPISVTADLPSPDDVTLAASHADVSASVAGTISATAA